MPRAVTHLKIVPQKAGTHFSQHTSKLGLGRILLAKSWVTEGDLVKAWSIQYTEQARIGEILIGMGKITIAQLYWALAMLHGLKVVDLGTQPPSSNWTDFTDAHAALKSGYLVWRNTGHSLTIAITDPNNMENLRKAYQNSGKMVDFVLILPADLNRFIATDQAQHLQEYALTYCPKSMSCQFWAQKSRSHLWGIAALVFGLAAIIYAPVWALFTALTFVLVALILLMGFRIACLIALRRIPDIQQNTETTLVNHKRPKVSIMVPVFKESAILERLIDRMMVLAYPKELLEICFVFEANDHETKAALEAINLPWFMKFIEVPSSQLQTKPRAMNYALDFCTGSIIGIYDAEDAPEENQIEQVIQKFAASDDNVVCIQCVLDFYNTRTNWISRCFTVEYAILFRLILPAMDRLKLPIPLGGTSVFFRRDALEKLGRWDAYNVTEDADLGYRMYQMGYRCAWINSVTYEEANYRLIPWIKQRSRWLKGFFLTALVHFKNPVKLHQKVGIFAVLTMLCLTVIPWILCPLAFIILPMWLLSFGYDLPFYTDLPNWFINTLTITFIATEIMSFYLGIKATGTEQHKHLRCWVLTLIFYWPIASFASYKALFEVFVRPAYWDKSEHGLNDQLYTDEITKLTRNTGRRINGA